MSTTTQHITTPPAPWKSVFLSHLSKMDSPEFVLSTLTTAPNDSPTPYLPRARYCIYRGMWAELPENKHNGAPMNERIYESEMPTFTSDVRMEKIPEIFASGPGKGDVQQSQGSGGGGPVEAVWWIKDDVMTQWRIRGTAWVVARDIEGGEESSGVRTVKSEVGERMRLVDGAKGKEATWKWGRELTAHFGNCSPGMRGSWKNPPPGTPAIKEPDEDHKLGQKVTDLEDKIARENFRVVIIKPDVVEMINLKDPAMARRHKYTFVSEKAENGDIVGKWTEEELWP